jgi:hypothetical protein
VCFVAGTYNGCVVVHFAEELAQAGFFFGGGWRRRHGVDAWGIIGILGIGIHLDVLLDRCVEIGLSFDGLF